MNLSMTDRDNATATSDSSRTACSVSRAAGPAVQLRIGRLRRTIGHRDHVRPGRDPVGEQLREHRAGDQAAFPGR
ncbi:hypothetical protein [Nocardia aurantiaca]|uniref:Uncharacterized protein n=1 Tax=Nocardia aurantiaca TaxID=2675850 RepID=A0A6I3KU77_9NOCA|nr:hypothetical protein [Nocardia aurantiaca]MTE12100.1 hypothetical protein [Nocardia aurantiaca]